MENKQHIINWLSSNTGLSVQSIHDFAHEVDNLYSTYTKNQVYVVYALLDEKICYLRKTYDVDEYRLSTEITESMLFKEIEKADSMVTKMKESNRYQNAAWFVQPATLKINK